MNPSTEQTLATIEAMRRQEEHHSYCVTDYLSEIPKIATTSLDTPVDASCRSLTFVTTKERLLLLLFLASIGG